MSFHWSSDFIGPTPGDLGLRVTIAADPDGVQVIMGSFQGALGDLRSGNVEIVGINTQWSSGEYAAGAGATVHVVLSLESQSLGQVDAGNISMQWQPTSGQAIVTQDHTGSVQQGLTPAQAQELKQSRDATWPAHLVDQLTLQFLGAGSSTTPIAGNLSTPVFGVIVRLTSIPSELQPQTPDGIYWVKTLASVLIFRGNDIWLRVPIHTPSKLINLWVEGIALGLADAVLNAGWLLNLTIQVFFLEGVEGQVFLMRTP
jgi:hypothetical protein